MSSHPPPNSAPTAPSSSESAPATTYRILRVPKTSPRLASLVAKSRATRLTALETDPTAFLAQHAVEQALQLSVWHARLTNPEVTMLACVASSARGARSEDEDEDDVDVLLQSEWLAVAALRGPMEEEAYYESPDMRLPVPEKPETEARWHVFDLYTLPAHRGRGLARRLVGACVETAVEYSRALPQTEKARLRLFMNPKNAWLVKVYESMGFVTAGSVTLTEGFRANCMEASLPGGTAETEEGRARWHTRFGMAMEQVVSLS